MGEWVGEWVVSYGARTRVRGDVRTCIYCGQCAVGVDGRRVEGRVWWVVGMDVGVGVGGLSAS